MKDEGRGLSSAIAVLPNSRPLPLSATTTMSSLKKLRISLEQNLSVSFLPSPTSPTDLFAPPTRLHDVNLSDGTQSFTSCVVLHPLARSSR
jgi:hypothetical protein